MADKKNPLDYNRKPSKGGDTPSWKNRPTYDGVPIGDRMTDANNETRGTGPRAPSEITTGGKGKKK